MPPVPEIAGRDLTRILATATDPRSRRSVIGLRWPGDDTAAMHGKLALLSLFLAAWAPWQDPEAAEPKRQLEVVVDGVPCRVAEGGEAVVKVGDREVKLVARVLPTRRFAAAGIGFEYPTGMAFEFDGEDGARSWSFDGNDVVLTVQSFEAVELDEIANDVLTNLRQAFAVEKEPVQRKIDLGGKERVARGIEAELAGEVISYQVVPIVGPKGGILVMLQDSAPLARPSAELKGLLDLLAKTFVIDAK
jgi:hypothetical protein